MSYELIELNDAELDLVSAGTTTITIGNITIKLTQTAKNSANKSANAFAFATSGGVAAAQAGTVVQGISQNIL